MTLPVVFTANGPSGYNLTKSLRFRSSASAYLSRTPASATNRTTWTYSYWVKGINTTGSVDYWALSAFSDGSNYTAIRHHNGSYIDVLSFNGGSAVSIVKTANLFRDPAAWYHMVIVFDTSNATQADRIQIYQNGVRCTIQSGATYPSTGSPTGWVNSTAIHYIGRQSTEYFDGYMAEINLIDGQALTPSSFGSTNATTGVWQPAKYTGTYGTNGFYLPFTDVATTSGSNAGLGKDFSGNGNYWTTNNISVTAGSTYDSMTDVPTLTSATQANYCVFNTLANTAGSVSITDGNLLCSMTASADRGNIGTMSVLTGKYYWELKLTSFHASGDLTIGISKATQTNNAFTSSNFVRFNTGNGWYYYGTQLAGTATGTWAANDVIGVALDMDSNVIRLYQNNTLLTTLSGYIDTTVPHTLMVDPYYTGTSVALNCGQQGFTYTPPTGFVALNTYNLPTSTIVQGNKYMDATLWAGTSVAQSITNAAGFKPDLVWGKNRTSINSHRLTDSVRGVGKVLFSDTTNGDTTGDGQLSSFNSNGFSLTGGAGAFEGLNESGKNYVGWQWQAGQGTTSSNTNGSITSTVSVNASAGFSIATYTGNGTGGATVGHGLGVAPSMIIIKVRSRAGDDWGVYHQSLGNTGFLALNTTAANTTSNVFWNSTSPTSSVFSLGTNSNVNPSGQTLVAYCWSEVAGFSKFGSYTANNSADGPFVYTGFRPRFILFKCTTVSADWEIYDSARDTYNVETKELRPNTSAAEATNSNAVDFLSNGFKLRKAAGDPNYQTNTYIYAAFAENPFKNSLAR